MTQTLGSTRKSSTLNVSYVHSAVGLVPDLGCEHISRSSGDRYVLLVLIDIFTEDNPLKLLKSRWQTELSYELCP
jgi:hypothetical protein